MKGHILKEKTERLIISTDDLEKRLLSETEVLLKIKKDAKEIEQESISAKLSYEAQKEQTDLLSKENEILVFGLLSFRNKN